MLLTRLEMFRKINGKKYIYNIYNKEIVARTSFSRYRSNNTFHYIYFIFNAIIASLKNIRSVYQFHFLRYFDC